jgi:hypothetical protein
MGDDVEVVIAQPEPHEQHVTGEQHRLHDPAQGRAPLPVAEVVAARQHDVLRLVHRPVELQEPALGPDNGSAAQDRERTLRIRGGQFEPGVVVRRDDLRHRERRDETVRQAVQALARDEPNDGVADPRGREGSLDDGSAVEEAELLEVGVAELGPSGEPVEQRLPLREAGAGADARADEEDEASAASMGGQIVAALVRVPERQVAVELLPPPRWPILDREAPRALRSGERLRVPSHQHDVRADLVEHRGELTYELFGDVSFATRKTGLAGPDERDRQERPIPQARRDACGRLRRSLDELDHASDDPAHVRRLVAADVGQPHLRSAAAARQHLHRPGVLALPRWVVANRLVTAAVQRRGDPGISAAPDVFDLHVTVSGQQPCVAGEVADVAARDEEVAGHSRAILQSVGVS